MKTKKAKSQISRRFDKARNPFSLSKSINLADNPDNPEDRALRDHLEPSEKRWPDWLNKPLAPQQNHPHHPATDVDQDNGMTVSTVKLHEDDSSDPHAAVENDIIETGKEETMQTATQDKPVSKIDLRDAPAAKDSALNSKVKPVLGDDIGSLFGPAIEDDAKGVRNQIRELIQCEMQGELGQRFSRNLRIVIRREIAAAIDDQFDRV